MTVVSVFFPRINARDIHLLPGLVSPRLDRLLAINDTVRNRDAPTTPRRESPRASRLIHRRAVGHGVSFNEPPGDRNRRAPPAGTAAAIVYRALRLQRRAQIFSTQIRMYVHEADQRDVDHPVALHVREGRRRTCASRCWRASTTG